MFEPFNSMPLNSNVWIYQCNTELTPDQCRGILEKGKLFTDNWAAHQKPLKASVNIFYNRFVVILVDEQVNAVSGCAIDESVKFIKNIESEFQITLTDRMNVCYVNGDHISLCQISEFEVLLKNKKLSQDTFVFNNIINTKADLECNWRIPVKDSWHKKFLG